MGKQEIEHELYFVDEARIVDRHDQVVTASIDLKDHVRIINEALRLLSELPRVHVHRDEDDLAVLRLFVRCFNGGASSLRLLRCGYFQPALTMVRDLVETVFLLDLFQRDRSKIGEWRTVGPRERNSRFAPFKVREQLDHLDKFDGQRRAHMYKLLSNHAAHPSPDGFQLISPGNMTQIGPFFDEARLRAGLEELSKHITYVGTVACAHVTNESAEVLATKGNFLSAARAWHDKYLK